MSIYDVYRHPESGKYQSVKQGFCWPALLFSFFWAFSRRLYFLGMVLGFVFVVVTIAGVMVQPEGFLMERLVSFSQISVYAAIAWFANDVRRWFLKHKGFVKQTSLSANGYSSAIRQTIDAVSRATVESD